MNVIWTGEALEQLSEILFHHPSIQLFYCHHMDYSHCLFFSVNALIRNFAFSWSNLVII